MRNWLILWMCVGVFSLKNAAQNSYTCEAYFLSENGPSWQPYFNSDTLKKRNIGKITVYAGAIVQNGQIEKFNKEYRIYRFLLEEGKITESVNFSRKDIYNGNTVGIPEEYRKYVYAGDTLITMYHTWVLKFYEERYAIFLSDYSINDYLDEISLEFATVSDVYLNEQGKIRYFKQRGEGAQILPENQTTYYYYDYDEQGRLSSMRGEYNLNPFGTDSVVVHSSRVEYDDDKRGFSGFKLDQGKEYLTHSAQVDQSDRLISLKEFNEHGEVINTVDNTYDDKGRIIRSEFHIFSKTHDDEDCHDLSDVTLDFFYQPDGLLHYTNVTTNKSKCTLLFTYN